MPLIKYFGFVGSALLLLLSALDWYFSQPVSDPIRSGTDKSVIRISSAERLPERVVIDTSLPTIVPPPRAMEFAERPPQTTFGDMKPGPTPAIPSQGGGPSKKPTLAKRESSRVVVTHRAAPPLDINPVPYGVQPAAPVTRMSLLDVLKERLGQSLFKLD